VNTAVLESAVMVDSAMLAGLGGALYASLYSLEPTLGSAFILKAVEAAIMAGIGNAIGALAGGVILGITEGVGSIYLPIAFRDAYGLVFLVAILLVKPNGLFGGKS
jgi:branched-chain amino acid transport system permease protein